MHPHLGQHPCVTNKLRLCPKKKSVWLTQVRDWIEPEQKLTLESVVVMKVQSACLGNYTLALWMQSRNAKRPPGSYHSLTSV